jgi:hypothetical protein
MFCFGTVSNVALIGTAPPSVMVPACRRQADPIPDLVRRDFTAGRPGEKMAGDITHIWTREGWLNLRLRRRASFPATA